MIIFVCSVGFFAYAIAEFLGADTGTLERVGIGAPESGSRKTRAIPARYRGYV